MERVLRDGDRRRSGTQSPARKDVRVPVRTWIHTPLFLRQMQIGRRGYWTHKALHVSIKDAIYKPTFAWAITFTNSVEMNMFISTKSQSKESFFSFLMYLLSACLRCFQKVDVSRDVASTYNCFPLYLCLEIFICYTLAVVKLLLKYILCCTLKNKLCHFVTFNGMFSYFCVTFSHLNDAHSITGFFYWVCTFIEKDKNV